MSPHFTPVRTIEATCNVIVIREFACVRTSCEWTKVCKLRESISLSSVICMTNENLMSAECSKILVHKGVPQLQKAWELCRRNLHYGQSSGDMERCMRMCFVKLCEYASLGGACCCVVIISTRMRWQQDVCMRFSCSSVGLRALRAQAAIQSKVAKIIRERDVFVEVLKSPWVCEHCMRELLYSRNTNHEKSERYWVFWSCVCLRVVIIFPGIRLKEV